MRRSINFKRIIIVYMEKILFFFFFCEKLILSNNYNIIYLWFIDKHFSRILNKMKFFCDSSKHKYDHANMFSILTPYWFSYLANRKKKNVLRTNNNMRRRNKIFYSILQCSHNNYLMHYIIMHLKFLYICIVIVYTLRPLIITFVSMIIHLLYWFYKFYFYFSAYSCHNLWKLI